MRRTERVEGEGREMIMIKWSILYSKVNVEKIINAYLFVCLEI